VLEGLPMLIDPTARSSVEVAPEDSFTSSPALVGTTTTGGVGLPGLVQYLVFEGQNPSDFIHTTRIPSVEYMPSGGPYPVTDALASEPMNELVGAVSKKYSLVLVVGPAVTRTVDTEILSAYANGVIVLLNEPLSSFSPSLESFFRSLKDKNAPLLGSVICV
jgi:hypothetical protein